VTLASIQRNLRQGGLSLITRNGERRHAKTIRLKSFLSTWKEGGAAEDHSNQKARESLKKNFECQTKRKKGPFLLRRESFMKAACSESSEKEGDSGGGKRNRERHPQKEQTLNFTGGGEKTSRSRIGFRRTWDLRGRGGGGGQSLRRRILNYPLLDVLKKTKLVK